MSEKVPPESVRKEDRLNEWDRLTRELRGRFLLTTKQRDDYADFMFSQSERIKELKVENTKLRELVRDAWGNGHPDKSCGECEMMDECHAELDEAHKKGNGRWNTRCLFERRIEDRMRELGIEVEQEVGQ